MVGVAQERGRGDFYQLQFDLERGLAGGEFGAVADAEQMGVDRDRRLAEGGVEDDIGGLAADPGKGFECLAGLGDFAAKLVDQPLREGDDVLGLGVEQADRLDEVAHPFLAERDHLRGRVGDGEQFSSREVDADVGRLRRERDRDEQCVGRSPHELALGLGVELGEAAVEFEDVRLVHQAPMTSFIE